MANARDAALAEFKRFDADNDGFISADEVRKANEALGPEGLSNAEIEEVIRTADRDGDGRLGLEEFVGLVGGGRHEKPAG